MEATDHLLGFRRVVRREAAAGHGAGIRERAAPRVVQAEEQVEALRRELVQYTSQKELGSEKHDGKERPAVD
ncbi:MAG: hypothetical protein IH820_01200 [Bacteroidetes bacterium]|nr:hypothetical protein [Bacteroidota bacterium]